MNIIEQTGRFATVLVMISVLLISAALVWTMQSIAAPKTIKMTDYVQCMDIETREDLRNTMRAGIDQAMQRHTSRMFTNWMKDPTDQPARAIAGMQNAVKAYVGSRKVANEWNPPPC
jgi:hypothetical protein